MTARAGEPGTNWLAGEYVAKAGDEPAGQQNQIRRDAGAFDRDDDCLGCHAVVQSISADPLKCGRVRAGCDQ